MKFRGVSWSLCCVLSIGCGTAESTAKVEKDSAAASADFAEGRLSADSSELIVDSVPSCPTCLVDTVRLGSFGSPKDSVLMMSLPELAVDNRGLIYATPIDRAGNDILVFDRQGTLRRVLGRQGDGPGEYRRVVALEIGPGDSVYIAHDGGRMSTFAPDGAAVRSSASKVFGMRTLLPMPNGNVFVSGTSLSPDGSGLPVHVYSSNGEELQSFGSVSHEIPSSSRRLMLGDESGAVWLLEQGNLLLEKYSSTGDRVQILGIPDPTIGRPIVSDTDFAQRERALMEWVASQSPKPRDLSADYADRKTRPRAPPIVPKATGLKKFNARGSLLIALQLPSDNWKNTDIVYAPGEEAQLDESFRPLFEKARFILVDPAGRTIITSRDFAGSWRAAGGDIIARRRTTEEGLIAVDVFRLVLRGSN